MTEFLRKLYGEVDFEGAREEMSKAAGGVLEDDFFLEQFKDEFVENARFLVSEAYCKIHHRIDIGCVFSYASVLVYCMRRLTVSSNGCTVNFPTDLE